MARTVSAASSKVGTVRFAARHQFPPAAGHQVEDALLARLGQAHVGPDAKAEVAGAPVHLDALRPGLGEVAAGGALDQQGEPAGTASVAVAARLPDGGNEARGEAVGAVGHGVCGIVFNVSWVSHPGQGWAGIRRPGGERIAT